MNKMEIHTYRLVIRDVIKSYLLCMNWLNEKYHNQCILWSDIYTLYKMYIGTEALKVEFQKTDQ